MWQHSADGNHQGPAHGAGSPHLDLNRARPENFNGAELPAEPAPVPAEPIDMTEELLLQKVGGKWKIDKYYIYPKG